MAKRPARKSKAAKPAARRGTRPTVARPEPSNATGADVLGGLDRRMCESVLVQVLNAIGSRTTRVNGPQCVAFKRLPFVVQHEAASAYLLDMQSASQVREAFAAQLAEAEISGRVFERFIKIVKEEYSKRIGERFAAAETDASLAAIKGDMPALSVALWSELVVAVTQMLRVSDFRETDNATRAMVIRCAEGSTDMAKVQAEVEKTRAQTAKLRGQIREDVAREAKKHGGRVTPEQLGVIVDAALGISTGAGVAA